MTAKNQQPLQVSLQGMDGRAHKTMLMFLQGPCKGSAVVVDVQSALQIALNRKQSLKLDSGWKDLLLFPQSREVWLDADEKQLRAFAGSSWSI
jgi:hypothetical protein